MIKLKSKYIEYLPLMIATFWLLGVAPFLLFIICTILAPFVKYNCKEQVFLILLIVSLIFSAMLSIFGGGDLIRFIAACNNIVYLFIGLITLSVFSGKDISQETIIKFFRNCLYVFIFNCIYIVFVGFVANYYSVQIELPSLLYGNIPIDSYGMYARYKYLTISNITYTSFGDFYRVIGIGSYGGEGGITLLVLGALSLEYLKLKENKIVHRLLIHLMLASAILFNTSRTAFLCYTLFLMYNFMFAFIGYYLKYGILIVLSVIVLIVIIWAVNFDYYIKFAENLRMGSFGERLFLYQMAINEVVSNNIIYGLGIKPIISGSYYPLGSHSTYISILVKGGIVAFSFYLAFILAYCSYILRLGVRIKKNAYGLKINIAKVINIKVLFVIILLFGYAFEDVDSHIFASIILFSGIGVRGYVYKNKFRYI